MLVIIHKVHDAGLIMRMFFMQTVRRAPDFRSLLSEPIEICKILGLTVKESITLHLMSSCPSTGLSPSYFFSSFLLFSPPPPTPSGFSSVSLWSSHSKRRHDQPLTSCLRPAWMSVPPVTQNATRGPLARATGICGIFWPMRHSPLMVNLLRLLLGSMATSRLLTPVLPTPHCRLGRLSGHVSGESDRSSVMMGVSASLDRTSCLNIHSRWLSNCPLGVLGHWWGTVMCSQLLIVFMMVKTM